jgi:hypothetical protein
LSLLSTFAGAWASLGADQQGRRYIYRALPDHPGAVGVFWFRGIELAPGQIVVTSVQYVSQAR